MSLMGRGVGYSYGLSQLAIMFGVVMSFPPASVQLFVQTPCVVNGTLGRGCGSTHTHRVWLLTPSLLAAGLTAGFASSTFTLAEAGVISEDRAYGAEALSEAGLWSAFFWMVALLVHLIVVMAACTPCDAFAAIGAAVLMVHFLHRICEPMPAADPAPFGGGGSGQAGGAFWSPMTANGNLLGYSAGLGVAFYCVPESYGNRFTLLFLLGVLDYFLGVGHVWDREPSTATIANCRLFWACSASLCLAALYGAWTDDLLMPSGVGRGDRLE
jgi:hypothetical protein